MNTKNKSNLKIISKPISVLLAVLLLMTSLVIFPAGAITTDFPFGSKTYTLKVGESMAIDANNIRSLHNGFSPIWSSDDTREEYVDIINSISDYCEIKAVKPTTSSNGVTLKYKYYYGDQYFPYSATVSFHIIVEDSEHNSDGDFVFKYDSIGNIVLAEYKGTSSNVEIPRTAASLNNGIVKSIGESAFENNTRLRSVVIPNSITKLDNYVFYGCSGLKSVTIPGSVTSMGDSVFYGCTSLNSVVIPNGVTYIPWYAFSGCKSLVSITIPPNVKTIDNGAFQNCTGLKSITIPKSVTSINASAFSGCPNLTITGYSGTAAEKYANQNGIKFISLDNPVTDPTTPMPSTEPTTVKPTETDPPITNPTNPSSKILGDADNDGKVTVKDATYIQLYLAKLLGENMIDLTVCDVDNDGNTKVKDVTYIQLFCANLQAEGNQTGKYKDEPVTNPSVTDPSVTNPSVTDPPATDPPVTDPPATDPTVTDPVNSDDFEVENKDDGTVMITGYKGTEKDINIPSTINGRTVSEIGHESFLYNDDINSVIIPDTVTSIGYNAFYICKNLKSITIGKGVKIIEGAAFANCNSLESVVIPNSVTYIGGEAFLFCSSLTSVTISENVTEIGEYAFCDCTSLTSITIPASVTEIGEYCFGYYNFPKFNKVDGYKIYGYKGTAAETYAEENGMDFITLN